MKVPVFQQTVVSISFDNNTISWVEISRLGNKIKLHSHGMLSIENEDDLSSALSEIKTHISSDSYLLAFSNPELLVDLIIEETPFFGSIDDEYDWVQNQKKIILHKYDINIRVEHHIIEVYEDYRRCMFQIVDEQRLLSLIETLKNIEFWPTLITPGIIETGYSQIYEGYFVEGLSGVLISSYEKNVLCCYQNGLIQNLYELEALQKMHLLENADSYLESEEVAAERQKGSSVLISLFDTEQSQVEIKREQKKLLPFSSKPEFEDLTEQYVGACGSAIKVFFPALDSINFSPPEIVEAGIEMKDKKETIQTAPLLLIPLMIIFLLFFAIENILDYKFAGNDQIMGEIRGKIELVKEKENRLNKSVNQLRELKKIISQRKNTAIVFELINNTIPENAWLSKLELNNNTDDAYISIIITGYALRERVITDFMGKLEKSDVVHQVMLSSIQQVTGEKANVNNSISLPVVGFEIKIQLDK